MRPAVTLAAALLVILSACGTPRADDAAAGPRPSTPSAATPLLEPPHAVLPDGTSITLELAVTPEEHQQGLMFRTGLPADRGMLFLFEEETIPSFWMKDTWIPLDIVFLGADGTVHDLVENAPPCTAEPCPQYSPREPGIAVLELNAGTAAAHGITRGSRIVFEGVPRLAGP